MSVILDQLVPKPFDQPPRALTLDEIIVRARSIKPTARVLSSAVPKKLNKRDGTHRIILSPGAKIGDVILGMFVLFTRRKKLITVEE